MNKKYAFTLLELMVVIAILGVIAAFSLPNYARVAEKTDERTAKANLIAIRSAVNAYMKNENAGIPAMGNITAINNGLGLSIPISASLNYACNAGQCTAAYPGGGWTVRFLIGAGDYSGGVLHCSAGTCPTCAADCG